MLGAVQVSSVSKTFSTELGTQVEALRDVSVDIRPGQFISFVGPSGCGKSTLLKMIGGLIEPSKGRVSVGGSEVAGPRRNVGVMFQVWEVA